MHPGNQLPLRIDAEQVGAKLKRLTGVPVNLEELQEDFRIELYQAFIFVDKGLAGSFLIFPKQ